MYIMNVKSIQYEQLYCNINSYNFYIVFWEQLLEKKFLFFHSLRACLLVYIKEKKY